MINVLKKVNHVLNVIRESTDYLFSPVVSSLHPPNLQVFLVPFVLTYFVPSLDASMINLIACICHIMISTSISGSLMWMKAKLFSFKFLS